MSARKSSAGQARDLIAQEIERTGPLTFSRYIELALYHPLYGYYERSADPRGRGGDYFTSVQVSPLFAEILADAIVAAREQVGSDQFALIELGSGGGELLESVLRLLARENKHRGLRVWAVERSRAARAALYRRLSRFPRCEIVPTFDDIDWMGTIEGLILSNEFFDALPFHRLRRRDGAWQEIFVDRDASGFVEKEGPPSDPALIDAGGLGNAEMADGHTVEVRPQIASLYEEWGARLHRGGVLTIDYGWPRSVLWHPSRAGGTMRGYREHRATDDPFADVGRQDITAHVDFTQLAAEGARFGFEPSLFLSQASFLTHVGARRIESFLASADERERRRRAGAIQQLLHPDAMGESFSVLYQSKDADTPPLFAGLPNRASRLA